MQNQDLPEFEDVGEAIAEGRSLRQANAYRIRFALDGLEFRPLDIQDPVPVGSQILEAVGLEPEQGYSLFAILPSGDFEDVRLDEMFDLSARGAERFVAFRTDRDFKLVVNDDELRWGKPAISGAELHRLAEPADGQGVYMDVRGGTDRLIERHDVVDLNEPGIERFFMAEKPVEQIEIIVNTRPRLVDGPSVTFEQIVAIAFPGQHDANVTFSMTFRHAVSKPHAGELAAGGIVEIKKGTTFNVTRTVQS